MTANEMNLNLKQIQQHRKQYETVEHISFHFGFNVRLS